MAKQLTKRFLMAVNSAFIQNFIVGQKVVTLMSLECTSFRGFLTNMKTKALYYPTFALLYNMASSFLKHTYTLPIINVGTMRF